MARGLKDLPSFAQVAVLALLAVVVVGLPSYFYVYPLFEQRAKLEKQVSDLKAENKTNQAFEQQQTQYKMAISGLEKRLGTLGLMVPDEQATDEFMRTVFADATEANVHVRTFVAQPLVSRDDYTEMPFKIHVDGTYWALVNYFDRLAHEQRIVSVTNLDLGPPAGGGLGAFEVSSAESVAANCTVTTYFNRPQQGAGPAPAKK